MDLLKFLKIMTMAILTIVAGYHGFNWMENKFGVKDSQLRYSGDDEEDPLTDPEQPAPMQDCYRHFDPTIIEMCLEASAKKWKKQE